MGPASQSVVASPASGARWVQLMIGIVGMVAIANLQYGWTLFVNPIDSKFHWGKAAIQVAFTVFVLAETWLVPVEGYLVDRFGPGPVTVVAGLTAVAPFAGVRAVIVGGAVSAVVNDQDASAASAFPARSFTPLAPPTTVAVYVVTSASAAVGVRVATFVPAL